MTALHLIPENAPFSAEQRAWLNGFFAGLLSPERIAVPSAVPQKLLEKRRERASAGEGRSVGTGAYTLVCEDSEHRPTPNHARAAGFPTASQAEEEDYAWHDPSLPLEERMQLAEGRPYELRLMAAMGQMDCGQCGYLCKSYAKVIARGEEEDLTLCVPGGKATARKLKELVAKTSALRLQGPAPAAPSAVVNVYTRKNPFSAQLKEVMRLTGEGSVKDTRHVVIDLSGSGITYEPGDSLGVLPRNCSHLVDEVLGVLGATGEETIETSTAVLSSRQALLEAFDITKPGDEAIAVLVSCATDPVEAERLKTLSQGEPEEGQDLLELLEEHPSARPRVEDLVPRLGRLQPRLFSIASSPKVQKDEVHLTVAVVRYERKHRARKGVASTFFADRLYPGDTLNVYLQPTYSFRLPRYNDAPIIMVGPGTGVAPFRAFLEERKARGAKGKTWLFFGNPNAATDFFYQHELEDYLREGVLAKLDTAFSRDQRNKIYVQHRMIQNSMELWAWLQEGACFYVCGDASKMAPDVDSALHRIAVAQGRLSEDGAVEFVKRLTAEGRYLRDVY